MCGKNKQMVGQCTSSPVKYTKINECGEEINTRTMLQKKCTNWKIHLQNRKNDIYTSRDCSSFRKPLTDLLDSNTIIGSKIREENRTFRNICFSKFHFSNVAQIVTVFLGAQIALTTAANASIYKTFAIENSILPFKDELMNISEIKEGIKINKGEHNTHNEFSTLKNRATVSLVENCLQLPCNRNVTEQNSGRFENVPNSKLKESNHLNSTEINHFLMINKLKNITLKIVKTNKDPVQFRLEKYDASENLPYNNAIQSENKDNSPDVSSNSTFKDGKVKNEMNKFFFNKSIVSLFKSENNEMTLQRFKRSGNDTSNSSPDGKVTELENEIRKMKEDIIQLNKLTTISNEDKDRLRSIQTTVETFEKLLDDQKKKLTQQIALESLVDSLFDIVNGFRKEIDKMKTPTEEENMNNQKTLPLECIEAIKRRDFVSAEKKLEQINDNNQIHFIIKKVYNRQPNNFGLLLDFGNSIRNIERKFIIYTALNYEMKSHGYKDPLKMIKLTDTLKKNIIDQQNTTSEIKLDAKSLLNGLMDSIKVVAKDMLLEGVLYDRFAITNELANEIYDFSDVLFKDIIKEVVDNVYGRVDTEKVLSLISNHKTIGQSIPGYVAVFNKMKSNGDLRLSNSTIGPILLLLSRVKETIEMPNYSNVSSQDRFEFENLQRQLRPNIKEFAKEKLIDGLSNDRFASVSRISNIVFLFNETLFKDIIKEVVDDIYGKVDIENMLNTVNDHHKNIEEDIIWFVTVFEKIKSTGDLNLNNNVIDPIFRLLSLARTTMYFTNYRILKTTYKTMLENLKQQLQKIIKVFVKEKLMDGLLNDRFSIVSGIANKTYIASPELSKDIIKEVVNDVYGKVDTEKILSYIQSDSWNIEEDIAWYETIFEKMNTNGDFLLHESTVDPVLKLLFLVRDTTNYRNYPKLDIEDKFDLEKLEHQLTTSIKMLAKKKLKDGLLNDRFSLVTVTANKIYKTSEELFKDIINEVVNDVYEREDTENMLSILSTDNLNIEEDIIWYATIYEKMKSNGDLSLNDNTVGPIFKLLSLVNETMELNNYQDVGSEDMSYLENIQLELLPSIKRLAKEKLRDSVSNDSYALISGIANKIFKLSPELFRDITKEVVNDVYGIVDTENMMSRIGSNSINIEEQILWYAAIFGKIKSNGDFTLNDTAIDAILELLWVVQDIAKSRNFRKIEFQYKSEQENLELELKSGIIRMAKENLKDGLLNNRFDLSSEIANKIYVSHDDLSNGLINEVVNDIYGIVDTDKMISSIRNYSKNLEEDILWYTAIYGKMKATGDLNLNDSTADSVVNLLAAVKKTMELFNYDKIKYEYKSDLQKVWRQLTADIKRSAMEKIKDGLLNDRFALFSKTANDIYLTHEDLFKDIIKEVINDLYGILDLDQMLTRVSIDNMNIEEDIIWYSAIFEKIKSNGDINLNDTGSPILQLFSLVSEVWNEESYHDIGSEDMSDIENLKRQIQANIKRLAKETIAEGILTHRFTLFCGIANQIYNASDELFTDIVKEVVNDVYGRVDTEKMLDLVGSSNSNIEENIVWYTTIFEKIKSNGDFILDDQTAGPLFKLFSLINETMKLDTYPDVESHYKSDLENIKRQFQLNKGWRQRS